MKPGSGRPKKATEDAGKALKTKNMKKHMTKFNASFTK
jgi:hypothetical protein